MDNTIETVVGLICTASASALVGIASAWIPQHYNHLRSKQEHAHKRLEDFTNNKLDSYRNFISAYSALSSQTPPSESDMKDFVEATNNVLLVCSESTAVSITQLLNYLRTEDYHPDEDSDSLFDSCVHCFRSEYQTETAELKAIQRECKPPKESRTNR